MASMRKHTTIDLDLELVREAAATLGTTRMTDTVHAALAEVVARRRRAALARMDLPDLTPEALDEMRSTRGIAGGARRPASRRARPATGAAR
jgi:Arc/MetJ family transcription regulator